MDASENSSFSAKSRNLQIAWDSTSLGLLKECPRKYQLSIVEGWEPKGQLNHHLMFGLHFHACLEAYDHARAAGQDHESAVRFATRRALESTVERLPSGGWRPWASGDPNKNRFTLVRSIVWYLEEFKHDAVQTIILSNGKPAVEVSFRWDTQFTSLQGETFMACGHMDRLGLFGGAKYVLDRKTSKNQIDARFFEGFSPDNQMSMYFLTSKVVFGISPEAIIIDGAQILVGSTRFNRGFVHRTDEQLAEFYADFGHYTSLAEAFALRNYWPMNDKSCGNYGGCPFRGICSKSPPVREIWLKATMKKRVWDPLQVRGDV